MLTHKIQIRIFDTDFLGHCHHLAPAMWFEEARNQIFEIFNPSMSREGWNLLLVHIDLDYKSPIQFTEREIEVRTRVAHVGNSSIQLEHGAYLQDGTLAAQGTVVMVYYDLKNQKTMRIPNEIREKLNAL